MKAQIQQILSQLSTTEDSSKLPSASVKAQLLPILNHLMDTSFMNFVQALYELDIDENKIMQITQNASISATDIADLIIERELKKIETRKLWKKSTKNIDDDLLL